MFSRKRSAAVLSVFLLALLFPAALFAAELHMYAGAGLKLPADEIIKRFEAQTGAKVTVEYAGMGQLLARYTATRTGDVFLSGSASYVEDLKKDKLVTVERALVFHTPVLVVAKSKAQGISTIEDLAKSGLRLAMGDPQAIALGRSGEKLLEASGFGDALKASVVVRGTTIKQVLLYVLNGDADAAVIGRSDAVNNPDLVILPTPAGTPEEVSVIAALSTSREPDMARRLVDFFASPESLEIFVRFGFLPAAK